MKSYKRRISKQSFSNGENKELVRGIRRKSIEISNSLSTTIMCVPEFEIPSIKENAHKSLRAYTKILSQEDEDIQKTINSLGKLSKQG